MADAAENVAGSINLEMDHIIPVSKGGRTEESNLADPVPSLQPAQVQEAGSWALKMSAAGETSRSIAVELALLFLRELETRVAEDPELLVSTEAVLSFAAVRRADPLTWQHWRRILEKYEKVGPDRAYARRAGGHK